MIFLAIIPARGGSKSVPLKNIKPLCGKPLLAYTIEVAQSCPALNRLIVSTDHDKIARMAQDLACEVMMRPSELATDEASTEEALIHVLDSLSQKEGYHPDVVLVLEPTSPLRTAETINKCIKILENCDADSVIGVVETHSNYGQILNDRFQFFFPNQPRRRQDRKPIYKESSTIYGIRTEVLKRKKSVLGDRLYPLIVPKIEAIDINDALDFDLAEHFIKKGGINDKTHRPR